MARALTLVQTLALGLASLLFASLLLSRPPASPAGPYAGRRRGRLAAAGLLVGLAAMTALVHAATLPGGAPALVATVHGRLLLAQLALLLAALAVLASMLRRLASASDRDLRWLLALEVTLGLGMTLIAATLLARPAAGLEALVWPFRFRLAPGVTWRVPSVQDQVIAGTALAAGGVLALALAYHVRPWRPLLVAAGVGLSVLGAYKALSAMTLDAYPTTYARPAVAATPESIRSGQDLFAAHCAVCHGPGGRGDGPAAAGLLQRPADLAASHTADHTPGDIFWWLTHGLGLAMPAFGDQLSTEQRWDLVNFVRTLSPPPAKPDGSSGPPGPPHAVVDK